MSVRDRICQAIQERRLLQFQYDGRRRVVEPHQLAYNRKNNLALSAWWISGHSASGDTVDRWREYLEVQMSSVELLDTKFAKPRPDYKKTPNKRFHNAICEL